MSISTYSLDDPGYPARLRALSLPPAIVSVRGPIDARFTVGIVGTRQAYPEAASFAHALAAKVVEAGGVVVSGGAFGIDEAAHRGALAASGRTIAVAPGGCDQRFPPSRQALFDTIAEAGSALVWPFAPHAAPLPFRFFERNRILVAMSDVLVVVQAPAPSGALNAARWARDLERPTWVVPGAPWDVGFVGSTQLLELGAAVLTSIPAFLRANGLTTGAPCPLFAPRPVPVPSPEARRSTRTAATPRRKVTVKKPPEPTDAGVATAGAISARLDASSAHLYEAITAEPRHIDEIAASARVCTSTAATGLLTLALENVVVEGPVGFYRRRNSI